ncbi:MAG: alanine racemase domain protein [Candidatus Eremiobacteraeota bacterium]|jgi:pyridoxal phosphate enzyme (YggS family)|nr:alanine racemase domain protein [Candidatus Eremiobacteraeota bacterium]
MPLATGTVAERVTTLRERVDEIAVASGRGPGSVAILAVTKTQPREAVLAALDAGLTDVGENYAQEARAKYDGLPPCTKHFVGHVQTNKAKAIAGLFDVVQSVDRLDAGLALAKAARDAGRRLRVLVQVNVSPAERFGAAPADAPALAARLRAEGLDVDGVMAIGPLQGDVDAAFATARETFERVGGSTLSMGMSGDWERAVRHGSTMVRLGTAIFGPRPVRERTLA